MSFNTQQTKKSINIMTLLESWKQKLEFSSKNNTKIVMIIKIIVLMIIFIEY